MKSPVLRQPNVCVIFVFLAHMRTIYNQHNYATHAVVLLHSTPPSGFASSWWHVQRRIPLWLAVFTILKHEHILHPCTPLAQLLIGIPWPRRKAPFQRFQRFQRFSKDFQGASAVLPRELRVDQGPILGGDLLSSIHCIPPGSWVPSVLAEAWNIYNIYYVHICIYILYCFKLLLN